MILKMVPNEASHYSTDKIGAVCSLTCLSVRCSGLLDLLTDCMHASRQTATQLMIGGDFKVNELRNRNERVFNKNNSEKVSTRLNDKFSITVQCLGPKCK